MSLFRDCLTCKRCSFRLITHLFLQYFSLGPPKDAWQIIICLPSIFPSFPSLSITALFDCWPSTAKALLRIPPTFPHNSPHTLFPSISTLSWNVDLLRQNVPGPCFSATIARWTIKKKNVWITSLPESRELRVPSFAFRLLAQPVLPSILSVSEAYQRTDSGILSDPRFSVGHLKHSHRILELDFTRD